MAFEKRPEGSEGMSHVDIWEGVVPGRGNSHSRGSEV